MEVHTNVWLFHLFEDDAAQLVVVGEITELAEFDMSPCNHLAESTWIVG